MKSLRKSLVASSVLVVLPVMAFAQGDGAIRRLAENRTNENRSEVSVNMMQQKKFSYIGKVTSINGNSIVILANKNSYTVDVTNAKLLRRLGGAMNLSDIQVNDRLNVVGTRSGTNITASSVRNLSLQTHHGTFVGTVDSVGTDSFVLKSMKRGNQTINTNSSTNYRHNGKSEQFSDIVVGAKVTVSGVWDRSNSNVTASKISIRK